MSYRSAYMKRRGSGYDINAYVVPAASKEAFTTILGLAVEILGPCGEATLFALDFVNAAGDYSTFEISKSASGPWAALVEYDCAELGTSTLYVRGDESLVVPSEVQVQANQGQCDGCP